MKNIYSNIIKLNNNLLKKIILDLKNNKLVGIPTETVYGLAGKAYSGKAVKKIFEVKKRPQKNPLIVHYYKLQDAEKDVIFTKNFLKLYKKLCPGPITFILRKRDNSKINNKVTANLNTVGIRFPKNPIIRKILRKIDFPLAMPSANKAGKVSPTEPNHVYFEFGKKIKIIDGGKTKIGLESTVVDLTKKIRILRPGVISQEKIQKILKRKIYNPKKIEKILSPGNLKKHYSPGIPLVLNARKASPKSAFIVIGNTRIKNKDIFNLSKSSNLVEAAKNLYKTLINIKRKKYKKIYVMKIPKKGMGIAINDRLKRAATK